MKTQILLISLLLMTLPLQAHQVQRQVPTPYQFTEQENASGLKESDVLFLLQTLDHRYGSLIQNSGDKWFSGFVWSQSYLGAGSTNDAGNFKILLWGGLIRARSMTFGALASVVCHELGHKLGGEPLQKFSDPTMNWSSAEGQADYFAASQCLPFLYEDLKVSAPRYLKTEIEPGIQALCRNARDVSKCQWVASSGVDLIETLQIYFDLDQPQADLNIWTKEKVSETLYTQYPSYQCRMDTFKSAARDPKAPRLPCWFAP